MSGGHDPAVVSPRTAWDALALAHGPSAAAWLVGRHRRILRRDGWVMFRVAPGAHVPTWFRVAVDYLAARTAKWRVVRHVRLTGERVWIVTWNPGSA